MPRAAMMTMVATGGSLVGSVRPCSHQYVGTPNTTRFASENARKTRDRTSAGPRSHAATPTMRYNTAALPCVIPSTAVKLGAGRVVRAIARYNQGEWMGGNSVGRLGV